MLVSMFAVTAASLEPTANSTNLIVTKYQIKQMNGEKDLIGNTDGLTGTAADEQGLDSYEKLSGVEFSIYRLGDMKTYVADSEITEIDSTYKDGKITYNGNVIEAFAKKVTDENGVATFNVTKDNYGLFFVKETSAPKNVTAKAQSFVVMLPKTNANGDGFLTDTYVYPKNYTTLGGGILRKVDSSQNIGLAGAKFALYDKATGKQVTEDFYGQKIGDSSNYLTTDANGYIYVNNLLVGEYYFVEKVAPEGYIVKSDQYSFKVEAGKSTEVVKNNNGTFKYDGITLLTADNSSKPVINKYVTELYNKEQNVAFGEEANWIIVASVPTDMGSRYEYYTITDTMDSELVFVDGSVLVSTSTDGENYTAKTTGFTVSDVENNVFTVSFTNTASLTGVKTLKIEYKTTVNEATTVMGDNVYNNVRLDYKTDATQGEAEEAVPPYVYTDGFKFIKTNIDGSKALQGAQFKVLDADNNEVRTGIVSDKDGYFEVLGLANGEYFLVETKAPKGYELLSKSFKFTVKKGSYDETGVARVRIENVPTPKVPLTGGIGTTIFTVTGLALILAGVILFAVSRKAKKSN